MVLRDGAAAGELTAHVTMLLRTWDGAVKNPDRLTWGRLPRARAEAAAKRAVAPAMVEGREPRMLRERVMTRSWIFLTVLILGLLPGRLAAQQPLVITGTVQWIDGEKMQVMADSGSSIQVSLERVDQSSYNTLGPGDRVRVVGVVAPDRSQLIADRVESGPNIQ
jgi:hypothetical protein